MNSFLMCPIILNTFYFQSFPPKASTIPTITTTHSIDDLVNQQQQDTHSSCNTVVNMEPSSSSATLQIHTNNHHLNDTSAASSEQSNEKTGWTTMTPQEISYWIDRRSRFLFPCAFIIFNGFYWTFVYCLWVMKKQQVYNAKSENILYARNQRIRHSSETCAS